ncbi:Hydrogenase, small subunit-like protein [Desulfofarcimen acetoxidans DSM 771]|jgi:Ni,Fe-hydrogenase III small subunit/NAD-dependent dihydropyrimidine dehydrogenase PreA subunit|uniref:Hydrogenase, small subunit-like protein n=1 Tax=Desulfofarcimen acetoxidans (strain ATCC 49208 / DSM 771 / KCTC 5769 / VKM B-1644 / 5575) TaxID=485916 RepID=C8W241_DESAS|nr:NADH-quinone oxidoreductase subunit NuoB [Desulfofarcimen acetoxidans]ACV61705.1 Hydrogenase, small subunit-like protein [Desulfofarcimen acetoxidans DSM 771]
MLKLFKGLMKTRIVTEDPRTWGESMGRGLPQIDMKLCQKDCNNCEAVCPVGAIAGKTVNSRLCIYCHACREVCPVGAIGETEVPVLTAPASAEDLGRALREKIKKICHRSLHIRYVDAGACNGCDFEINSMTNPVYDIQQYGVDFVASPRHADMLLVTGVVTRNLEIALHKTYEACPRPALVVAVGACACGGGVFKEAYASGGGVDKFLPVDVYVPGCPPTPAQIIKGILTAIGRL